MELSDICFEHAGSSMVVVYLRKEKADKEVGSSLAVSYDKALWTSV